MLVLGEGVLEKIIEHCKKVFPLEACGVLSGKETRVEKVFPLTNIEKDAMKYFADSKEQLRTFKEIENLGMKLLGIYHSHPNGPAYPSDKDIELAFYETSYLIVSLREFNNPEIKAYKIEKGKVREEELITEVN
ncbi:MAG: M67 family metallopeptidase [Candidatus Omnitrophota bacterium]